MAGYSKIEFSEEGITVAMAQSVMSEAMRRSGVNGSELARRMGVNRSRSVQVLTRDMTMRTFARVLAACGFEARFSIVRIESACKLVRRGKGGAK